VAKSKAGDGDSVSSPVGTGSGESSPAAVASPLSGTLMDEDEDDVASDSANEDAGSKLGDSAKFARRRSKLAQVAAAASDSGAATPDRKGEEDEDEEDEEDEEAAATGGRAVAGSAAPSAPGSDDENSDEAAVAHAIRTNDSSRLTMEQDLQRLRLGAFLRWRRAGKNKKRGRAGTEAPALWRPCPYLALGGCTRRVDDAAAGGGGAREEHPHRADRPVPGGGVVL